MRTLRTASGTASGATAAALAVLAALVVLRPDGGPVLTLAVCLTAAVVAGAVGLLVAGDAVDVMVLERRGR